MFQALVSAYLWDVVEGGVEDVLDMLHGEVGVTGVALWVALPPVTQLRTLLLEPRVFRTRGGLFFQPAKDGYDAARCKPVPSTWLKGRNPLVKIAEVCTARGLELRLIASAAATGRIASRQPEMACKNVFGVESQLGVCLANPDVRHYLSNLAADLSANYGPAELSLTDLRLSWPEAFSTELEGAALLGETQRSLLSICFCESCQQGALRAGVDVAAVGRLALATLARGLRGDSSVGPDFEALLTEDAPLGAYAKWQSEELSTLLRQIKAACKCPLLWDRGMADSGRLQFDDAYGSIPDGVITCLSDPGDLDSVSCPTARRNELRLPNAFVTRHGGQELVSTLAKAAKLGFTGVQIDNYGVLPAKDLTAIKQAFRFARRSTGA